MLPDGLWIRIIVRLYFTPFCQLDGWSYPEKIADELKDVDGLPAGFLQTSWLLEWFDLQTYLERIDLENVWLGEAVNKLLKNHFWDMFFMHTHCTDLAYVAFINKLDPEVCENKSQLKIYQDAEMQIYQSLDRVIGKIVECADENSLTVIVSDHGATPTEGRFEKDFKEFYVERL